MIGRHMDPREVVEAIAAVGDRSSGPRTPTELLEAAEQAARRPHVAYRGGEEAVEMLIRKAAEAPQSWNARRQHFRNVPVVRQIVDVMTQLVYGQPPDISVWVGEEPIPRGELAELLYQQLRAERGWIEDAPEAPVRQDAADDLAAWFADLYETNDLNTIRAAVLRERMLCGYGLAKVWPVLIPDSETQLLRITCKPAVPVQDPEDADSVIGVVERLARGAVRVWGGEGFLDLDESGDPIGGTDAEAAEILRIVGIPFAVMGNGRSLVSDAILDQKVAINRDSTLNLLLRRQGFALGVMSGRPLNAPTRDKASGEEGIALGPEEMLHMADGGSFTWASPNAPLGEHREAVKEAVQNSLRAHGLPEDYYQTGAGVTQPMAKALSWMPTFLQRHERIAEAEIWEKDLAWLCARYAAAMPQELGAPEFSPDDFGCSLDWNPNPLPTDRTEQINADLQQVTAGTMTKVDFLCRRHPEWPADRIAQYAVRLEEAERGRFDTLPATPFDTLPPLPEEPVQ